MSTAKAPGILQYWQPLVGIATFLVAGGIFYGKISYMQQKLTEIESRQDRQFQLYQTVEKRVSDLEKQAAYEAGYHKGAATKNEEDK